MNMEQFLMKLSKLETRKYTFLAGLGGLPPCAWYFYAFDWHDTKCTMWCLPTTTHWVSCDSPDRLGSCADSSAAACCGSTWGLAAGELAARVHHDDAELSAALLAVIRDVCGGWAPAADKGAPALPMTWHPHAC